MHRRPKQQNTENGFGGRTEEIAQAATSYSHDLAIADRKVLEFVQAQAFLSKRWTHHDALEFPDGDVLLLTYLMEGQGATVLQLPAVAVGSKAPQRAAYV